MEVQPESGAQQIHEGVQLNSPQPEQQISITPNKGRGLVSVEWGRRGVETTILLWKLFVSDAGTEEANDVSTLRDLWVQAYQSLKENKQLRKA